MWATIGVSFLSAWLEGVAPVWLLVLALLAAFGESAPAVGLLVPGQTILFGAGFLAGEGLLDPFVLGALVALGGFAGDSLGFILGRRWGLAPLRALPQRLRPGERGRERLRILFERHGAKAVILARFQPIGRAFGPYFAGASGMQATRFLAADAAASIAAAAVLVGLGYLAGLGFERLSQTLGVVAVSIITLLLVVLVGIGLRLKHKREGKPTE